MESSEDDAGTATNASRRASAREKDVGMPEDTNATRSIQQEPSETRTSCQTPAMSEDNFDGDSVPSPSTQDVNTSTEAILDMIDEIVDGPGAPKRLPLECDAVDEELELVATTSNQNVVQESTSELSESIPLVPPVTSPAHSAASDNLVSVNESSQVESLTHSEPPTDIVNEHLTPESSSTSTKDVSVSSLSQESLSVDNDSPVTCPLPNISSSSGEQTVQSIVNISVCQTQQSTVKHVTSSDSRDNVTVESAESTSSDTSVSEGKSVPESETRSPLRRRLVRPAPSDRRPDSTVSSTVDSQINASPTQQPSDIVAKDVTSSSDAVPATHGNVKPEEISNVSEINVCKAETSVSPPKKIKLVRQKVLAGSSNKDVTTAQSTLTAEKVQCQSTSDNHVAAPLDTKIEPTITDNTIKIKDHADTQDLTSNVTLQKENNTENTEEVVYPDKHSQSSTEQSTCSPEIGATKDTLPSDSISLQVASTSDHSASIPDVLCAAKLKQLNDHEVSPEKSSILPPKESVPNVAVSIDILESSNVEISPKTNSNDSKCTINNDLQEHKLAPASSTSLPTNCDQINTNQVHDDEKKVPPIKLNLSLSNLNESKKQELETETSSINKHSPTCEESDSTKQVPKLTIKLKQPEEVKPSVPKLTIKPLKPPQEQDPEENIDSHLQIPKITIKPISKCSEGSNEKSSVSQKEVNEDTKPKFSDKVPNITKLNIKPILKPPEKINDIHRKSSSSEISESEYSENDESASTSDQASASDQGPPDVVPKVTIKLGKPGTDCEGKFYTEQNAPKLTIKNIQHDENNEQETNLKVIISHSEDKQAEKVPKFTIRNVTKSDGQPLSPKLTIKPLKPPDSTGKDVPIESYSSELKESPHVPKITIKPVTRTDIDTRPSKNSNVTESPDFIPIVTKLNIKPVLKPMNEEESSEVSEDEVPVVSKLNIKPVIKPKDSELDSSIDDIPKVTKLNIKPLKNPEEKSSTEKDCDELNADADNSIPVVTKLNIKPIVKPQDVEMYKESENQSSETGNSSDDNTDHIPVVTKINIKPIVKPDNIEEPYKSVATDLSIPVVTKLNIKPVVKPGENISPMSPNKVKTGSHSPSIPVVTKLNIKPIVRPDDVKDESDDKAVKNPPLVMKINMKPVTENTKNENLHHENTCNNIGEGLLTVAPQINRVTKELNKKSDTTEHMTPQESTSREPDIVNDKGAKLLESSKQNCIPDSVLRGGNALPVPNQVIVNLSSNKLKRNINSLEKPVSSSSGVVPKSEVSQKAINETKLHNKKEGYVADTSTKCPSPPLPKNNTPSIQNCTLLKQLLENTKDSKEVVNCMDQPKSACKDIVNSDHKVESARFKSEIMNYVSIEKIEKEIKKSSIETVNDISIEKTAPELHKKLNDHLSKPLEISISDKTTNQSSGQDSPRIILKINKTDHGPSAKIITEDPIKHDIHQTNSTENAQDLTNNQLSPNKHIVNMKKKLGVEGALNLSTGKRLRSSRIVENMDKSPMVKGAKNTGKRSSETSPPQSKDSDGNMLQEKRLKLGQLLSNKSLSITPVSSPTQVSPTKPSLDIKQSVRVNHLLNNENCSKNGSSKLHNILSNLQAKQMQSFANTICSEKAQNISTDIELNASTSNSDLVESLTAENPKTVVQEMLVHENSAFSDFGNTENSSQDPLEFDRLTKPEESIKDIIAKSIELTPQPKKRGRPRKIPASEGAKPAVPVAVLPVTALEERPQRSLRLMRDRPAVSAKPRGGRGRGRGGRRADTASPAPETVTPELDESSNERPSGEIDPNSSRIKLPRMTEALDNMPSVCNTPLSSRRRDSSGFSTENTELKMVIDSSENVDVSKSPEPVTPLRGRGSRGGRGGRGRTPRGRGRGRGGGRGAVYMKETMGIYGRVCGPATTTVQLFEEETCMMDDNATPAKTSHLLDEDSQSSVKSSTNESSKMKKSKFADLFDSNKVWTAADVKEYTWPLPGRGEESKVMMIQEQVAMFLNVKSFKRRYSELKRRTIGGDERDYVLSKGLVTEALCDLGITAVDASEVLDIMLSDYPHKYEEYRSYQRQRQLTEVVEETVQSEDKTTQTDNIKKEAEKLVEQKPEVPKVDPEKTRQDMAAAAIASASEWNARANALRRGACADLQSLSVLRPRVALSSPATHLRPPAGFYPHALLPGQYQHSYRLYPADQLRFFPLNTVLCAPDASEACSSESERDWRDSDSDDSDPPPHLAKRKRLTKSKRSSQTEIPGTSKEEPREEVVDLCRVCKLRLEANRRYTHERFLVCATCNAKHHPSCLDLSADTIRKCREYSWQCAECKSCCTCRTHKDDDKMLFCDLCDRGFHMYCVGLDTVPSGRWHCVECAICKSCGSRSPAGEAGADSDAATWHHHTRRGPGGHKVYSHSLCTPCARAYRIGRYCPLCDRSFIGPKGTMQLVICKLCDRQLHQECVKQTVVSLNVLDYTCAECRRGGITSRAAAVRLAPRTIATLFMAKRRFNKYAHRQYMESRQRPPDAELPDADAPDASDTDDA